MKTRSLALLVACAGILMAGCAPQSPYAWNDYRKHLYQYEAQEIDAAKMLEHLLKAVDEAEARHVKLAPGLYAEIGTMYFRLGKPEEAIKYYKLEADTWPESAPFMNSLATNVASFTAKKKEAAQ